MTSKDYPPNIFALISLSCLDLSNSIQQVPLILPIWAGSIGHNVAVAALPMDRCRLGATVLGDLHCKAYDERTACAREGERQAGGGFRA